MDDQPRLRLDGLAVRRSNGQRLGTLTFNGTHGTWQFKPAHFPEPMECMEMHQVAVILEDCNARHGKGEPLCG